MKTPTGNPLEIYLAFNPEEHWKVIESDTAPFIADDKNPEWYIKLSEFDAAQARIAALSAENERLRKALEASRDVHAGLAEFILQRPDKAKAGLTKEQAKGVFADLQRARLAADEALEAKP